ncbi:MAG: N4-gp56 family major capsid protein [Clostridium sp.]|nr:N4-gp56 family major capsid protein [Clostridium sp.]
MPDLKLNSRADINSYVEMAQNAGPGVINPEVFYSKQLLDTIRYDASDYVYYRLADAAPIQEKADKIMIRRWAPLQAHTEPLEEGIPPMSDKGSVEKYEITAYQYGRYMEFTDKVDFRVVDPVIAHYTKEYTLVAMETLDLLAKDTLLSIANAYFAGAAKNFEGLTVDSKPRMVDLRLIVLSLKKALVKPRANGKFHVIASPEFFYDMISDPIVEKYMTINNTTKTMYENSMLVPMFDMEFYESFLTPTTGEFIKDGKQALRIYRFNATTNDYEYATIDEDTMVSGEKVFKVESGYVKDVRTGDNASYIPNQRIWDLDAYNAGQGDIETAGAWTEFKAQHVLVVGKDALTKSGLTGEESAKMYVKEKGSAGVLDPIDQRQSIGFKINSVGFGSTRLEAVVDYICVPSQLNAL